MFGKHAQRQLGAWGSGQSITAPLHDGCLRRDVDTGPTLAEDREMLSPSSCFRAWPRPLATQQPTRGGSWQRHVQREAAGVGAGVGAGVCQPPWSRPRLAMASSGNSPRESSAVTVPGAGWEKSNSWPNGMTWSCRLFSQWPGPRVRPSEKC